MPDEGNGFKLKTVEDIAKLNAAIEILTERISTKMDGLQKDIKILSEQVRLIKEPCNTLKEHLDSHKSSTIMDWTKRRPIQATLIGLFIISQLGISLDKLVEIITKLFIKA